MKAEADRAAVKHTDQVEGMLAKFSKELEDAGPCLVASAISCCFLSLASYL